MYKLDLSEIKETASGILKFIKDVCDSNSIRYYLAYGTCLGAVRHKGFIPWDDDVDIIMFRDDYNRFAAVMEKMGPQRYQLYDLNCKNFNSPLPKVVDLETTLYEHTRRYGEKNPLGVYVDIIIFDTLPQNETEREKYLNKLHFMFKIWSASYFTVKSSISESVDLNSLAKMSVRIFARLISPKSVAKKIMKLSEKFNGTASDYVGPNSFNLYPKKSVFEEKMFGDGEEIEFENVLYMAPQNYRGFLEYVYGDFMKLPPEEKRITKHTFDAYLKKES